jgi:anaerobic selenocysteine-containing dehydrogenase
LTLITPASDRRITSTFGGLAASDATPVLEMNPADAMARELVDGASVRVWNELGQVLLPLRITSSVRPGVVSSEKGAWLRTSTNGQTVSALAPTLLQRCPRGGGRVVADSPPDAAPGARCGR